MPFILPRHDQLLRDQRKLPADQRQSRVMLTFERAIPRRLVSEFQRIHLTPAMLNAGEDRFFEAKVFQPHRVRRRRCPICGCEMDPQSPTVSKCRNKNCSIPHTGEPTSLYEFHRGPVRGVVFVLTLPAFVVHREKRTSHGYTWIDETVDRAVLVLDRRYDPAVLAAVRRSAAQICETWGWGLK